MHHNVTMEPQNDDEAIDSQIEKELNALTEDDLELLDDRDDEEEMQNATDQEDEISESMQQYLKYVQEQEDRWKEEMQECDQILYHTETVLTTPRSVRLDKDLSGEHSNPEQLTNEVLNELEKAEEEDRQKLLDEAEFIVQGNGVQNDDCNVDVNCNSPLENKLLERSGTLDIGETNDPANYINGEGDAQEDTSVQPQDGVVAVLLDSDTLERNMHDQIREWEARRVQLEEKRRKELEESKLQQYRQGQEEEFKRKEIRQKLFEEQEQLQRVKQEQEEKMNKEAEEISQKLEDSLKDQKEKLEQMDKEVKQEKENLEKDQLERAKLLEKQRESAATRLQAAFRSLRVRLEMSGILNEKREQRKTEKENERIKALEDQRRKAEEQKAEEERMRKEEEERDRKRKEEEEEKECKRKEEESLKKKIEEEERKRQEEEETKKKEEEILRNKEEAERKKKEKEELRKQQEEERKKKKEEELKRKQEEEIKRKEEAELKKRREEEMKKQKEEEESRTKEEEAKRKLEEELKKKEEEELRFKQEGDRKRKAEEEKRKKIEEEERKIQEEKDKVKAEEEEKVRQVEIEIKIQREIEEKNRAAIQRMQASLTTSSSSDKLLLPPKRLNLDSLQQLIDERRLSWIKQCKPWSQTASEHKCRRPSQGSKRLPRRPSSNKDIPDLSEGIVIQLSKSASLLEVTTVEIKDLPGCRDVHVLAQCPNLQCFTMNNCQLQTLDGLQSCSKLQYLDVKHNHLELVDLRQMRSLVYVNISYNKLTSVHGVDGCSSLKYLSVAGNNISRIGGLDTLLALHTLDVSHNQLINCQGLRDVITLQVINVSHNHLPALDDIKHLGLLQCIDASHNNIMQIPDLTNQILLRDLILHNNSISSIKNLSTSWLPLLRKLDLSQNSLLRVDELPGCVLLHSLDLSNNQILEQDALLTGLSTLQSIQHLTITGNPVTTEPSTERCVHHYVQSLHTLNGTNVQNSTNPNYTDFQTMCLKQLESHDKLQEAFQLCLSSSVAQARGQLYELYFNQSCVLATEHRYMHEYGTISLESENVNPNFDIKDEVTETKHKTDPRSKFESALVKSSPRGAIDPKSQFDISQKASVDAKSRFDSSLQSQTMKNDAKSKFDSAFANKTSVTASVVGQILEQPTKKHHVAATTIQASWRGYLLRKRLQMAFDYARFEDQSDDEDDFFNDEIDMAAFNFNEDDLDADWKCPATPQLPSHHPVVGSTYEQTVKYNPVSHQPHPPGHPRQAWRNPESPMMQHFPSGKPPLPPVSPSVGAATHRTMETNKTKKSEQITEEWGFKDSRTAELMLQRAKKLKYNSQRKKKLSQLDPRQKLALFKKLEESKNLRPVQPPARKGVSRKEYFQAKEEEEYYKSQNKIAEQTTRGSRTYEWVHEQVGSYEPDVSPPRHGMTKNFSSEGSLPQIDRGVLAGGRANLTGSPVELESVSSYSNATSWNRRHSSTEGSAVQLPHIKTNSAPSVHQKERMSFRNPVVKQSVGWGGGKKRGKRF